MPRRNLHCKYQVLKISPFKHWKRRSLHRVIVIFCKTGDLVNFTIYQTALWIPFGCLFLIVHSHPWFGGTLIASKKDARQTNEVLKAVDPWYARAWVKFWKAMHQQSLANFAPAFWTTFGPWPVFNSVATRPWACNHLTDSAVPSRWKYETKVSRDMQRQKSKSGRAVLVEWSEGMNSSLISKLSSKLYILGRGADNLLQSRNA